jgi:predicted ATP-grasp superfamily ATP-dependent carboligase
MTCDIVILGASARAATFSALRAGLAPYAIDLFADRDLTAVCPAVKIARYPSDFLAALAAAPPAPWLYTGGLENHPRLVDRLTAIRPLLGNGGSVLRAIRDPQHLAQAAEAAGCSFPDTPAASNPPWGSSFQWLVKPRRGSGGQEIRFLSAADSAGVRSSNYLQRYIEGESASAVFVAAQGEAVLLGVSRQLLGRDFGLDRPFLYVGSIAPLALGDDERKKIETLGCVLAARCGLVGLFNVDFVRTSQQLWPVEVNPRYSASVEVLERISDFSALGCHVAACRDGLVPSKTPGSTARSSGKAVVYAPGDLRIPAEFDALVSEWNRPGQPPSIADLPMVGQSFSAGEPVATMFAEGDSESDVERTLRAQLAEVMNCLSTRY